MEQACTADVEVDVASRLEVIDALEEAAVDFAVAAGLDREPAQLFGLAVREALTNAIRHGNGLDPERPVRVSFGRDDAGGLLVHVRDWGPGFVPSEVPDPRLPQQIGLGCGRGLFFMRRFADEVRFEFPSEGGCVVSLRKRLA